MQKTPDSTHLGGRLENRGYPYEQVDDMTKNELRARLPEHMRAMPVKGEGSRWLPQEQALLAPWVQLHHHDRHWMMCDLDEQDWVAYKRFPLEPNVVSYNPESGHSQHFWLLRDPVYCLEQQRAHKAYRYLRAIESAVDAQYGTDPYFARAVSKNPIHLLWDTDWRHSREHSLGQLHDALRLDLSNINARGSQEATNAGEQGRNNQTFNTVRYWAYEHADTFKQAGADYEDWYTAVLAQVSRINARFIATPAGAMCSAECSYLAKSIAEWCWNRRVAVRKKPRLTVDQIRKRQSTAAKERAIKASGETETKIKIAILRLQADGKKVTKAAVARAVNISRTQVSNRYSHLFD